MGNKKKKKKNTLGKRVWYFRVLKWIMRVRYKEPDFRYLGEEITNGGLILSNHEGTDAPLSLEIYSGKPLRMWGAYEMNSGLVKMYKYQSRVYFHEKKHWNLHLARLFCLIASPLTWLYYSGLNLISVYRDMRLLTTIRESIEALEAGENIAIYPEKSDKGYLAELEGFFAGFVMLAEVAYRKKKMDIPIFVSYFRKKDLTYIIDKPVRYSELAAGGASREEIAKMLCDRCNELGKMQFDADGNVIAPAEAPAEEAVYA